ncbi:allantoin permease [Pseudomonas sp. Fl5BN2]|uniref:purine-cytosine permease family protein n=1 Tax=unclassified Pseudomonas TaxID=196821 RepID=UPI0013773EA1|nr:MULTISPECIES: cytosine permease [unclassified Pseudomonas]NBF03057.1 allantoin permease [Pseudomonas sp. Fl5BN2]NBF11301.1 allantoin permease [Pseudomonas sp. Fl4BN1]
MQTQSKAANSASAHGSHSAVEGHSIDFIPESERTDKLRSQGPFWFLGNFTFFTMTIGFVGPSVGLTSLWTTLAGTLGIMFGTLFMAFHGSQGPHLGLPQMIQSRAQFGYRGVILVLLATLFVFAGFNIVNLVLMMQGLHSLFGFSPIAIALAVTVPAAVLAILGHDWMHRSFKWALYLSLPLYGLVTLAVMMRWVPDAPLPVLAAGEVAPLPLGFNWTGFITQFAAAASYNIAYAPYVSDYSRYLPKNTPGGKLIAVVFLGASLSGAWMIAVGGWLAEHLHTADVLVALGQVGNTVSPLVGTAVVVVTILAFLPVIAMNIYSAKLTTLTCVDSIFHIEPTRKARVLAIIFVILLQLAVSLSIQSSGSGLSVLGIYLVVMLYFLVPWTAVNLTDYFFVRKGRYAIPHFFQPHGSIYGNWGLRGIAAYAIGFIAMIPFFYIFDGVEQREVYVGPLAKALGNIDVAWLVGLIVSALAYYWLSRSLDLKREETVIQQIEASNPHYTTGDRHAQPSLPPLGNTTFGR